MKKSFAKFLSVFLALLIVVSSLPMDVAAYWNGNAKDVTLTFKTDKNFYSLGETITVSVKAKNNTDEVKSIEATVDPQQDYLFTLDKKFTIENIPANGTKTVEYTMKIADKELNSLFGNIINFFTGIFFNYIKFDHKLYIPVNYRTRTIGINVKNVAAEGGGDITPPIPEREEIYFSEPAAENIVLDEHTGEQYVNNEILVTAVDGVSYEDVEAIISEYNGTIVGWITEFGDYQIRLNSEYTKDELNDIINELSANENIHRVALNYAMQISEEAEYHPNDPWDDSWWPWGNNQDWNTAIPDGNNWGVEAIKAPVAWTHRDEMSPIKIGLIDSGVDTAHPDLTVAWSKNNSADDHGTHVAGIMAADWDEDGISGVMPTENSDGDRLVTLYSASQNANRVKDLFTFEMKSVYAELIVRGTKVINISQGFNWYMPRRDSNDVIIRDDNGNIVYQWDSSYCTDDDLTDKARNLAVTYAEEQEDFLKRAILKGYEFVIVKSAGNNSNKGAGMRFSDDIIDAKYTAPTNAIDDEIVKDRIIIVGAIANKGKTTHWFSEDEHNGYEIAYYSDRGSRVDVVAPGSEIYSCYYDKNNASKNYDSMSGTSMATPHVSGVAAMVWAINPNLTGAQVKEIIKNTADRPVDGYKILNAENAVNEAIDSKTNIDPWQPEISNGTVISRVVDVVSNDPIENAVVSAYKADGTFADSVTTDVAGQFELILPEGTYTLTASKDGYIPGTLNDIVVEAEEVHYCGWFKLAAETVEMYSVVNGVIKDATNNNTVQGVTIKFVDSATLETLGTATTDSTGRYSITLPVGYYQATAVKDGYIPVTFNVTSSPELSSVDQNASISPVLAEGTIRIVLTWGDTPRDLDSHLVGPMKNIPFFHIAYYNEHAYDANGNKFADLDVDDTTQYGPETVTLDPNVEGIYEYFIHDYSNGSGHVGGNGQIGISGAQVKVYKGDTLVATYNAPTDQGNGIYWNVFTYNSATGVITSVNTITNTPESVYVTDYNDRSNNTDEIEGGDEPTVDVHALTHVNYDEIRYYNDTQYIVRGSYSPLESVSVNEVYEGLIFWGWVGATKEIKGFSYSIDNGEKVFDESFRIDPDQAVIDRVAEFYPETNDAYRYKVRIPLSRGVYDVRIFVEYEDDTCEEFWFCEVTVEESDEYDIFKNNMNPAMWEDLSYVAYDEIRDIDRDEIKNNIRLPEDTKYVDIYADQTAVFWGWVAAAKDIKGFAYSVDGGEPVYDASFKYATEQAVIDAAYTSSTHDGRACIDASRYLVAVPTDMGEHLVSIYVVYEDGTSEIFWTCRVNKNA